VSITAILNESRVTNLQHVTLRAAHGNAATFRLGSRFPVLNGTFAPVINTPAINDLLEDQTFVAPFPSFSYEDLGITLKATPLIHGRPSGLTTNSEITLTFELEIRSLSGAALNGVPVLTNRQFNAAVRLREGEPAVVVGMISRSEQKSISGLPGLGQLPLFKWAVTNENKNVIEDELLFLITPYIVRSPEQKPSTIWLPVGQ
jgi:general secretion pathway protein D